MIKYFLHVGNRPPKPTRFNLALLSISSAYHTITFTWDLVFSTCYVIEYYSVNPATTYNDSVLVSCPMHVLCPFDRPCVCNVTGQLPMEGINMTISAVNCDGQEGSTAATTVLPKGRCVITFYFSFNCITHNQTPHIKALCRK